eukprot:7381530-Prymnesium_polylepis.1
MPKILTVSARYPACCPSDDSPSSSGDAVMLYGLSRSPPASIASFNSISLVRLMIGLPCDNLMKSSGRLTSLVCSSPNHSTGVMASASACHIFLR